MTNKKEKNLLTTFGSMALILTISWVGLSGCSIKEVPPVASPDAGASTEENTVTPTAQAEGRTLADYIKLLGMNKEELTDTLGETPASADEGGLDFTQAGIRIWFDTKTGTANQIFTQNKDSDLNGVKIGDKIEAFEDAFGKPVSDRNGDMHFKYNDVFLSINYDTVTKETYALYILTEDF